MTRRNQYHVGIFLVAPVWFIASFMLQMMLLGTEDPGWVYGEIVTHVDGHEIHSLDPNYKGKHQGEFPPVPLWLKIANGIAIPALYVLPEDGFRGLSDHANGISYLLVMFANSVLRGCALVFLFRSLARFFVVKKNKVKNTV
jgi:hypothetical protein